MLILDFTLEALLHSKLRRKHAEESHVASSKVGKLYRLGEIEKAYKKLEEAYIFDDV